MDQWNASLMNNSIHSFIQFKFNLIVFYVNFFWASLFYLFIYFFLFTPNWILVNRGFHKNMSLLKLIIKPC